MKHTHDTIAHVREADGKQQSLAEHLVNVGSLAGIFAAKAGLKLSGELIGTAHDLGKGSNLFQAYINSSAGLLDQDHDDYVDAKALKGKIDHSTAGAQLVWDYFKKWPQTTPYVQILALCIASHHSSLIDCLAPDGTQVFSQRMDKAEEKTHFAESRQNCDPGVINTLKELLSPETVKELFACTQKISARIWSSLPAEPSGEELEDAENCRAVEQGLLTRFLLSCLLDADRIDSAEFGDPKYKMLRARLPRKPWERLTQRLEAHLRSFAKEHPIDDLRGEISEACRQKASDSKGLFTLTVPTGGGKTLASLRFALHHAQKWNMERIFYIIPYTSIIDQNAEVARKILEHGEEPGSIVLEHHSNLLPEEDSWQNKLLAENWEAPVVFTTMVQFLESLFGSGTRHARHMHNLANSIIIFDEIQTLPLRCMHLFCNALTFLLEVCGSTSVLCTATQPCLDTLPRPSKGGLVLAPEREIIPDVSKLFTSLKRVHFFDHCDTSFSAQGIADLAVEELHKTGSCLVVCNTKKWAEDIYRACRNRCTTPVYYLSTNLCPAHRMDKLQEMRTGLAPGTSQPVLCISTQLIECGVDVSFGSVIRCAAGLDSILQAAGRCNRHGGTHAGRVHIVRVENEHLDMLEDIRDGRDIYLGIIRHGCRELIEAAHGDLNQPEIITSYFRHYFQRRKDVMPYATPRSFSLRNDTLLNMLGSNKYVGIHMPHKGMSRQSFATAASLFQPIDTATTAVIVPYAHGKDIIGELASFLPLSRKRELLHAGQRYAVNVYPNTQKALGSALHYLQDSTILFLSEQYYDKELGVITTPDVPLSPLIN